MTLQTGGSLTATAALDGQSFAITTGGDLVMAGGVVATASGGMALTVGGDARIGRLIAGSGPVTLAVTGALLSQPGVAGDAVTTGGDLTLGAARVGADGAAFAVRAGRIVSATATAGDLFLAVANGTAVALDSLTVSQGAAALTMAGAGLTLGTTAVRDGLAVRVTGGGLALTGDVVAQGIVLSAAGGGIAMSGISVIRSTATGTDLASGVSLEATGAIALGRIEAGAAEIRVVTSGGALTDVRGDESANIVTTGRVTLAAGSGDLTVTLRGSSADDGAATAGDIDVVAGSIGGLSAAGDLTVVGCGAVSAADLVIGGLSAGRDLALATASVFLGTVRLGGASAIGRDARITLGSGGLVMDSAASLTAGRNLDLTTAGDAALSRLSAAGTLTIAAAGRTLTDARTEAAGAAQEANIVAGTLAITAARLGSAADALDLDAATIAGLTIGGDAWVGIATAAPAGAVRPTVTLDTATIGGALRLTVAEADLALRTSLTATSVDANALVGRFDMAGTATLASTGAIALAGNAGLGIGRVVGDAARGTAQVITLTSAAGAITDSSADEAVENVVSKGTLVLAARSVGSMGDGDLDVAVAAVGSVRTDSGSAYITFSLDPIITGISVSGALVMDVATEDLILQGTINAGSVQVTIRNGRFVQQAGSVLLSQGGVSVTASGDIDLTRIEARDGNILLSSGGDIRNTLGGEGTNLVVANGALTLSAVHVGSAATALVVDTPAIARVEASAVGTGETGFTIVSARGVSIGSLSALAEARFTQASGDVTMTGASELTSLTLTVAQGAFTQAEKSRLTLDGDLRLTASGDVTLASVTSYGGNVTVVGGGAILDGTASPAEGALITTVADGGWVDLSARRIGTSVTDGDIDLATRTVRRAVATEGDLRLGLAAGTTVQTASAGGAAVLTAASGDLTLDGRLSAMTVQVGVDRGSLIMTGNAAIAATSGTQLTTGRDMVLGTVDFGAGTLALTAGGAVTNGNASAAANLTGSGALTLTAGQIGREDRALVLDARRIDSLTTTAGGAWLSATTRTGFDAFELGTVGTGANGFALTLATGGLSLSGAVTGKSATLRVAQGALAMGAGSSLSIVGDLTLDARDDITLTQIATEQGTIALTSRAGRVLDGTANEIENIVATGETARVTIDARGVGGAGAGQDLNVAIRLLDRLSGGADGVYLAATRALTLGTLATTGRVQAVVDDGSVDVVTGGAVGSLDLTVRRGGLVMASESDLTVNGDATLSVRDDVTLSHLVVAGGTLDLVSSAGRVIDGTLADGADRPNIAVTGAGRIQRISALAIGDLTDDGDIDISAARVISMEATAGGMYVKHLRGVEADSLRAKTTLRTRVVSGGLVLNGIMAAETVTLTSDNGDVTLKGGSALTATGALTMVLGTGSLTASDAATIGAGAGLSLTVGTGDVRLGSDARLTAGGYLTATIGTGTVTVSDRAAVGAGGALAMTVGTGSVRFANAATMSAGTGTLGLSVTRGDVSFADAASLTAGGAMTLTAGDGNVSFGSGATLRAASLDLTAKTGTLSLADTASAVVTGNLTAQVQGAVTLSNAAALRADGKLVLTVAKGAVSVSDRASVTAGKDLALTVGTGDVRFGNEARLTAGGTLTATVGAGAVSFADAAGLTAGGAMTLTAGDGKVSFGSGATLRAASLDLSAKTGTLSLADTASAVVTGNLTAQVQGAVTLSNAAALRADGKLLLTVTKGAVSASDRASVTAGKDLALTVGAGDVSFADAASLTAGGAMMLAAGDGNVSFGSGATLRAASLDLTAKTGTLSLADTASAVVTGNLTAQVQGAVTLSNAAALRADGKLVLTVAKGAVSVSDRASVTAGKDLALTVGTGDVRFGSDAVLRAGGALTASVGAGSVHFAERAGLTATQTLVLSVGTGDVSFADAAILSTAGAMTLSVGDGNVGFGSKAMLRAGSLGLTTGTGALSLADGASAVVTGNLTATVQGAVTLSNAAVLRADGSLTMAVAKGAVSVSDRASMSAGQDLAFTVGAGDVRVGTDAGLSAGGSLAASVGTGSVTVSDRAVVSAGRALTMAVGTGSVRFASAATMTAGSGPLGLTVTRGDVSFADASSLTASGAMTLTAGDGNVSFGSGATLRAASLDLTAGTGSLSLADGSTAKVTGNLAGRVQGAVTLSNAALQADGSLALSVVKGDLSVSDRAAISAGTNATLTVGTGAVRLGTSARVTAGGDLSATIGTGNVRLEDRATVSAGSSMALSVGAGDLSLASGAAMTARKLWLDLASGNLSTDGEVTITAADEAGVSVGGDIRLNGRTTVLVGNVLSTLRASGTVALSGDAAILVGRSAGVAVGGDLTLSDRAAIAVTDANGTLSAHVVGDVTLREQARVTASTGAAAIAVERGSVVLGDRASVVAGRLVLGIARGALTMADADTRLIASDRIEVIAEGDIRLDRVEATNAVTMTSRSGAILDNTAAEDELIVTGTLSLAARDGVGRTADDLNVKADVLNASSERSGGINVRMRNGFRVGERGVVNRGTGDIILFSQGRILYSRVGFQSDRAGDFPSQVINGLRQGTYITQNGATGFQIGLSTIPAGAAAYLSNPDRLPKEIASTVQAEQAKPEGGETPSSLPKVVRLASRPIRMATAPVEANAGSILETLGLGDAAADRSLIPEVKALREAARQETARKDRPVELEDMLNALSVGRSVPTMPHRDVIEGADLQRSLTELLGSIEAVGLPQAGTPANDQAGVGQPSAERGTVARRPGGGDDDLDAPLVPMGQGGAPAVGMLIPAAE
ncbi:hypothetical protein [Azospirillum sp. sgz302134]